MSRLYSLTQLSVLLVLSHIFTQSFAAQLQLRRNVRKSVCTAPELMSGISTCSLQSMITLAEDVEKALPEGCLYIPDYLYETNYLLGVAKLMLGMDYDEIHTVRAISPAAKEEMLNALAQINDRLSLVRGSSRPLNVIDPKIQRLISATADMLESDISSEEVLMRLSAVLPLLPETLVGLGGQSADYFFQILSSLEPNGRYDEEFAMKSILASLNAMAVMDEYLELDPQNMTELFMMATEKEPNDVNGGTDIRKRRRADAPDVRDGGRLPNFRPISHSDGDKDFPRDSLFDHVSDRIGNFSDAPIGEHMLRPEPEGKPRHSDIAIDRVMTYMLERVDIYERMATDTAMELCSDREFLSTRLIRGRMNISNDDAWDLCLAMHRGCSPDIGEVESVMEAFQIVAEKQLWFHPDSEDEVARLIYLESVQQLWSLINRIHDLTFRHLEEYSFEGGSLVPKEAANGMLMSLHVLDLMLAPPIPGVKWTGTIYPVMKTHIESMKRLLLSSADEEKTVGRLGQLVKRVELLLTQLGELQPSVVLAELSDVRREDGSVYHDQLAGMDTVMEALELMARIDETMSVPPQGMFDLFLSLTGDADKPEDMHREKRQVNTDGKPPIPESDEKPPMPESDRGRMPESDEAKLKRLFDYITRHEKLYSSLLEFFDMDIEADVYCARSQFQERLRGFNIGIDVTEDVAMRICQRVLVELDVIRESGAMVKIMQVFGKLDTATSTIDKSDRQVNFVLKSYSITLHAIHSMASFVTMMVNPHLGIDFDRMDGGTPLPEGVTMEMLSALDYLHKDTAWPDPMLDWSKEFSMAIGSFINRLRRVVMTPGISATDFLSQLDQLSLDIRWGLTKLGSYQAEVGFSELSRRRDGNGEEYYDLAYAVTVMKQATNLMERMDAMIGVAPQNATAILNRLLSMHGNYNHRMELSYRMTMYFGLRTGLYSAILAYDPSWDMGMYCKTIQGLVQLGRSWANEDLLLQNCATLLESAELVQENMALRVMIETSQSIADSMVHIEEGDETAAWLQASYTSSLHQLLGLIAYLRDWIQTEGVGTIYSDEIRESVGDSLRGLHDIVDTNVVNYEWVASVRASASEYSITLGYVLTQVSTPQAAMFILETTMLDAARSLSALGVIEPEVVLYDLSLVNNTQDSQIYHDENAGGEIFLNALSTFEQIDVDIFGIESANFTEEFSDLFEEKMEDGDGGGNVKPENITEAFIQQGDQQMASIERLQLMVEYIQVRVPLYAAIISFSGNTEERVPFCENLVSEGVTDHVPDANTRIAKCVIMIISWSTALQYDDDLLRVMDVLAGLEKARLAETRGPDADQEVTAEILSSALMTVRSLAWFLHYAAEQRLEEFTSPMGQLVPTPPDMSLFRDRYPRAYLHRLVEDITHRLPEANKDRTWTEIVHNMINNNLLVPLREVIDDKEISDDLIHVRLEAMLDEIKEIMTSLGKPSMTDVVIKMSLFESDSRGVYLDLVGGKDLLLISLLSYLPRADTVLELPARNMSGLAMELLDIPMSFKRDVDQPEGRDPFNLSESRYDSSYLGSHRLSPVQALMNYLTGHAKLANGVFRSERLHTEICEAETERMAPLVAFGRDGLSDQVLLDLCEAYANRKSNIFTRSYVEKLAAIFNESDEQRLAAIDDSNPQDRADVRHFVVILADLSALINKMLMSGPREHQLPPFLTDSAADMYKQLDRFAANMIEPMRDYEWTALLSESLREYTGALRYLVTTETGSPAFPHHLDDLSGRIGHTTSSLTLRLPKLLEFLADKFSGLNEAQASEFNEMLLSVTEFLNNYDSIMDLDPHNVTTKLADRIYAAVMETEEADNSTSEKELMEYLKERTFLYTHTMDHKLLDEFYCRPLYNFMGESLDKHSTCFGLFEAAEGYLANPNALLDAMSEFFPQSAKPIDIDPNDGNAMELRRVYVEAFDELDRLVKSVKSSLSSVDHGLVPLDIRNQVMQSLSDLGHSLEEKAGNKAGDYSWVPPMDRHLMEMSQKLELVLMRTESVEEAMEILRGILPRADGLLTSLGRVQPGSVLRALGNDGTQYDEDRVVPVILGALELLVALDSQLEAPSFNMSFMDDVSHAVDAMLEHGTPPDDPEIISELLDYLNTRALFYRELLAAGSSEECSKALPLMMFVPLDDEGDLYDRCVAVFIGIGEGHLGFVRNNQPLADLIAALNSLDEATVEFDSEDLDEVLLMDVYGEGLQALKDEALYVMRLLRDGMERQLFRRFYPRPELLGMVEEMEASIAEPYGVMDWPVYISEAIADVVMDLREVASDPELSEYDILSSLAVIGHNITSLLTKLSRPPFERILEILSITEYDGVTPVAFDEEAGKTFFVDIIDMLKEFDEMYFLINQMQDLVLQQLLSRPRPRPQKIAMSSGDSTPSPTTLTTAQPPPSAQPRRRRSSSLDDVLSPMDRELVLSKYMMRRFKLIEELISAGQRLCSTTRGLDVFKSAIGGLTVGLQMCDGLTTGFADSYSIDSLPYQFAEAFGKNFDMVYLREIDPLDEDSMELVDSYSTTLLGLRDLVRLMSARHDKPGTTIPETILGAIVFQLKAVQKTIPMLDLSVRWSHTAGGELREIIDDCLELMGTNEDMDSFEARHTLEFWSDLKRLNDSVKTELIKLGKPHLDSLMHHISLYEHRGHTTSNMNEAFSFMMTILSIMSALTSMLGGSKNMNQEFQTFHDFNQLSPDIFEIMDDKGDAPSYRPLMEFIDEGARIFIMHAAENNETVFESGEGYDLFYAIGTAIEQKTDDERAILVLSVSQFLNGTLTEMSIKRLLSFYSQMFEISYPRVNGDELFAAEMEDALKKTLDIMKVISILLGPAVTEESFIKSEIWDTTMHLFSTMDDGTEIYANGFSNTDGIQYMIQYFPLISAESEEIIAEVGMSLNTMIYMYSTRSPLEMLVTVTTGDISEFIAEVEPVLPLCQAVDVILGLETRSPFSIVDYLKQPMFSGTRNLYSDKYVVDYFMYRMPILKVFSNVTHPACPLPLYVVNQYGYLFTMNQRDVLCQELKGALHQLVLLSTNPTTFATMDGYLSLLSGTMEMVSESEQIMEFLSPSDKDTSELDIAKLSYLRTYLLSHVYTLIPGTPDHLRQERYSQLAALYDEFMQHTDQVFDTGPRWAGMVFKDIRGELQDYIEAVLMGSFADDDHVFTNKMKSMRSSFLIIETYLTRDLSDIRPDFLRLSLTDFQVEQEGRLSHAMFMEDSKAWIHAMITELYKIDANLNITTPHDMKYLYDVAINYFGPNSVNDYSRPLMEWLSVRLMVMARFAAFDGDQRMRSLGGTEDEFCLAMSEELMPMMDPNIQFTIEMCEDLHTLSADMAEANPRLNELIPPFHSIDYGRFTNGPDFGSAEDLEYVQLHSDFIARIDMGLRQWGENMEGNYLRDQLITRLQDVSAPDLYTAMRLSEIGPQVQADVDALMEMVGRLRYRMITDVSAWKLLESIRVQIAQIRVRLNGADWNRLYALIMDRLHADQNQKPEKSLFLEIVNSMKNVALAIDSEFESVQNALPVVDTTAALQMLEINEFGAALSQQTPDFLSDNSTASEVNYLGVRIAGAVEAIDAYTPGDNCVVVELDKNVQRRCVDALLGVESLHSMLTLHRLAGKIFVENYDAVTLTMDADKVPVINAFLNEMEAWLGEMVEIYRKGARLLRPDYHMEFSSDDASGPIQERYAGKYSPMLKDLEELLQNIVYPDSDLLWSIEIRELIRALGPEIADAVSDESVPGVEIYVILEALKARIGDTMTMMARPPFKAIFDRFSTEHVGRGEIVIDEAAGERLLVVLLDELSRLDEALGLINQNQTSVLEALLGHPVEAAPVIHFAPVVQSGAAMPGIMLPGNFQLRRRRSTSLEDMSSSMRPELVFSKYLVRRFKVIYAKIREQLGCDGDLAALNSARGGQVISEQDCDSDVTPYFQFIIQNQITTLGEFEGMFMERLATIFRDDIDPLDPAAMTLVDSYSNTLIDMRNIIDAMLAITEKPMPDDDFGTIIYQLNKVHQQIPEATVPVRWSWELSNRTGTIIQECVELLTAGIQPPDSLEFWSEMQRLNDSVKSELMKLGKPHIDSLALRLGTVKGRQHYAYFDKVEIGASMGNILDIFLSIDELLDLEDQEMSSLFLAVDEDSQKPVNIRDVMLEKETPRYGLLMKYLEQRARIYLALRAGNVDLDTVFVSGEGYDLIKSIYPSIDQLTDDSKHAMAEEVFGVVNDTHSLLPITHLLELYDEIFETAYSMADDGDHELFTAQSEDGLQKLLDILKAVSILLGPPVTEETRLRDQVIYRVNDLLTTMDEQHGRTADLVANTSHTLVDALEMASVYSQGFEDLLTEVVSMIEGTMMALDGEVSLDILVDLAFNPQDGNPTSVPDLEELMTMCRAVDDGLRMETRHLFVSIEDYMKQPKLSGTRNLYTDKYVVDYFRYRIPILGHFEDLAGGDTCTINETIANRLGHNFDQMSRDVYCGVIKAVFEAELNYLPLEVDAYNKLKTAVNSIETDILESSSEYTPSNARTHELAKLSYLRTYLASLSHTFVAGTPDHLRQERYHQLRDLLHEMQDNMPTDGSIYFDLLAPEIEDSMIGGFTREVIDGSFDQMDTKFTNTLQKSRMMSLVMLSSIKANLSEIVPELLRVSLIEAEYDDNIDSLSHTVFMDNVDGWVDKVISDLKKFDQHMGLITSEDMNYMYDVAVNHFGPNSVNNYSRPLMEWMSVRMMMLTRFVGHVVDDPRLPRLQAQQPGDMCQGLFFQIIVPYMDANSQMLSDDGACWDLQELAMSIFGNNRYAGAMMLPFFHLDMGLHLMGLAEADQEDEGLHMLIDMIGRTDVGLLQWTENMEGNYYRDQLLERLGDAAQTLLVALGDGRLSRLAGGHIRFMLMKASQLQAHMVTDANAWELLERIRVDLVQLGVRANGANWNRFYALIMDRIHADENQKPPLMFYDLMLFMKKVALRMDQGLQNWPQDYPIRDLTPAMQMIGITEDFAKGRPHFYVGSDGGASDIKYLSGRSAVITGVIDGYVADDDPLFFCGRLKFDGESYGDDGCSYAIDSRHDIAEMEAAQTQPMRDLHRLAGKMFVIRYMTASPSESHHMGLLASFVNETEYWLGEMVDIYRKGARLLRPDYHMEFSSDVNTDPLPDPPEPSRYEPVLTQLAPLLEEIPAHDANIPWTEEIEALIRVVGRKLVILASNESYPATYVLSSLEPLEDDINSILIKMSRPSFEKILELASTEYDQGWDVLSVDEAAGEAFLYDLLGELGSLDSESGMPDQNQTAVLAHLFEHRLVKEELPIGAIRPVSDRFMPLPPLPTLPPRRKRSTSLEDWSSSMKPELVFSKYYIRRCKLLTYLVMQMDCDQNREPLQIIRGGEPVDKLFCNSVVQYFDALPDGQTTNMRKVWTVHSALLEYLEDRRIYALDSDHMRMVDAYSTALIDMRDLMQLMRDLTDTPLPIPASDFGAIVHQLERVLERIPEATLDISWSWEARNRSAQLVQDCIDVLTTIPDSLEFWSQMQRLNDSVKAELIKLDRPHIDSLLIQLTTISGRDGLTYTDKAEHVPIMWKMLEKLMAFDSTLRFEPRTELFGVIVEYEADSETPVNIQEVMLDIERPSYGALMKFLKVRAQGYRILLAQNEEDTFTSGEGFEYITSVNPAVAQMGTQQLGDVSSDLASLLNTTYRELEIRHLLDFTGELAQTETYPMVDATHEEFAAQCEDALKKTVEILKAVCTLLGPPITEETLLRDHILITTHDLVSTMEDVAVVDTVERMMHNFAGLMGLFSVYSHDYAIMIPSIVTNTIELLMPDMGGSVSLDTFKVVAFNLMDNVEAPWPDMTEILRYCTKIDELLVLDTRPFFSIVDYLKQPRLSGTRNLNTDRYVVEYFFYRIPIIEIFENATHPGVCSGGIMNRYGYQFYSNQMTDFCTSMKGAVSQSLTSPLNVGEYDSLKVTCRLMDGMASTSAAELPRSETRDFDLVKLSFLRTFMMSTIHPMVPGTPDHLRQEMYLQLRALQIDMADSPTNEHPQWVIDFWGEVEEILQGCVDIVVGGAFSYYDVEFTQEMQLWRMDVLALEAAMMDDLVELRPEILRLGVIGSRMGREAPFNHKIFMEDTTPWMYDVIDELHAFDSTLGVTTTDNMHHMYNVAMTYFGPNSVNEYSRPLMEWMSLRLAMVSRIKAHSSQDYPGNLDEASFCNQLFAELIVLINEDLPHTEATCAALIAQTGTAVRNDDLNSMVDIFGYLDHMRYRLGTVAAAGDDYKLMFRDMIRRMDHPMRMWGEIMEGNYKRDRLIDDVNNEQKYKLREPSIFGESSVAAVVRSGVFPVLTDNAAKLRQFAVTDPNAWESMENIRIMLARVDFSTHVYTYDRFYDLVMNSLTADQNEKPSKFWEVVDFMSKVAAVFDRDLLHSSYPHFNVSDSVQILRRIEEAAESAGEKPDFPEELALIEHHEMKYLGLRSATARYILDRYKGGMVPDWCDGQFSIDGVTGDQPCIVAISYFDDLKELEESRSMLDLHRLASKMFVNEYTLSDLENMVEFVDAFVEDAHTWLNNMVSLYKKGAQMLEPDYDMEFSSPTASGPIPAPSTAAPIPDTTPWPTRRRRSVSSRKFNFWTLKNQNELPAIPPELQDTNDKVTRAEPTESSSKKSLLPLRVNFNAYMTTTPIRIEGPAMALREVAMKVWQVVGQVIETGAKNSSDQTLERIKRQVSRVAGFAQDDQKMSPQGQTGIQMGGLWTLFLDAAKCGQSGDLLNVISPNAIDMLGILEPMIIYYKNSFVVRHVLGDKPIRMLRSLAEEYLGDKWMDPMMYTFRHVEAAIRRHCQMMTNMNPEGRCMREAVFGMGSCRDKWADVGPIVTKMTSKYCTADNYPKKEVVESMKENFPYVTNIVGCFVTNGMFDFPTDLDMEDSRFWSGPLGRTIQRSLSKCHLMNYAMDMAKHVQQFFTRRNPLDMDVVTVYKFIANLSKRSSYVLRCLAKVFHPYCASKGIDLSDVMQRVMPQLSLATGGLIDFPVQKLEYTVPKNFASRKRRTVSVFGDPHVSSYSADSEVNFQTCNELETFEEGSLLSAEPVELIKNNFYDVHGYFGRFSLNQTGTYLAMVNIEFLKDGEDPTMSGESSLYMTIGNHSFEPMIFEKDIFGESNPMSDYKKVLKYGTGKNVKVSNRSRLGVPTITVKDEESGSVISISNPYGSLLNLVLRSAVDLLDISTGILIEGCMDSDDRVEFLKAKIQETGIESVLIKMINVSLDLNETETEKVRVRRDAETDPCNSTCYVVNDTMTETCLYDCYQALNTPYVDEVGTSMLDVEMSVEEAVVDDDVMMETAVQEEVPEEDVITTTMIVPVERFFMDHVPDNSTEADAKQRYLQSVINRRGPSIAAAIRLALDDAPGCSKSFLGHMILGICWDPIL